MDTNRAPDVTAILPTYNAAAFLEETLEALIAQDKPVKILVGDDASSDGTQNILSRYAERSRWLTIIARDDNLGWIGNTNDLLRRVDTEFAFFAFHDDVPEPTYVSKLTASLHLNPQAVLAYSDMRLVNIDLSDTIESFSALSEKRLRVDRGWVMLGGPARWWVPIHGVFRTATAQQLGGLRPHAAGEFSADWPFLLHLSLLGEFERVPEVLIKKVYQPGSVSRAWERTAQEKAALKEALAREIDLSPLSWAEKALLRSRLKNYRPAPRWVRRTVRAILRQTGRRRQT